MKFVPLLLLLSSMLLLPSQLRPAAGWPRPLQDRPRPLTFRLDGGDHVRRSFQRRDPDPLWEKQLDQVQDRDLLLDPLQVEEEVRRSEEAPLSIDLTFHLLRNMIQMAQRASQRERALLNRKVLDQVGR